MSAYEKLYGYRITVYSGKHCNSNVVESIKWDGFYLPQLTRWNWYFEYRYALLRIKYPKNGIKKGSFDYEITPDKACFLLKNKIKAKKSKITEFKNKLSLAEQSWNQIFPIEDDELYQKCVEKIKKLEFELNILIAELNNK